MTIETKQITPAERYRTYTFPGGESVTIAGVCEIAVRESGTHRLTASDGTLHIVPTGWLHIEIGADGWSL